MTTTPYDDELDDIDAPVLETPSANSSNGVAPTAELDDHMKALIGTELQKLEDLPQFVKFFTSQDVDDLKITSEIPRRMVLPLVGMDMAIEASAMLARKYLERAERSRGRYVEEIEAYQAVLDDALDDGVITEAEQADLDKRMVQLNRAKRLSEKHLKITENHILESKRNRSMLERWRKSFLQYMRGVDRKGAGELIELWAVYGSDDDDKDVDDDE